MRIIITLFYILFTYYSYAQAIVGKWKSIDDQTGKPRSIVEIYQDNGRYFGKITDVFLESHEPENPVCELCPASDARYNQPIKGMMIIENLKKEKSKEEYNAGRILDPETGGIYDCKIWLDNGQLKVRGYLYFLYRTQTWMRIE